jgi:cytochrome P450
MTLALAKAPTYDIDFYADAVIADPYPHYRAMRDLAPVVWLPQNSGYAITRFGDVRDALRNPEVFQSGRGVMMNDPVNAAASGTSVLNMDDPQHAAARRVLAKPLLPGAVKLLQADIARLADQQVDRLVARGSFDGISDFAHFLPLTLVTRLVGLPEEGQTQMLEWATGIFNVIGNMNERFAKGAPAQQMAGEYLRKVPREYIMPGSWAARLFQLVDDGAITDRDARLMMFDYVAPALDTTINATSGALWLFGQHPEQWDLVRADPSLIPAALDEAMRLETPIRAFSRYVARDHDVDGITIPEGSRTLIVYASANRDERRWEEAERFDIRRRAPQEQLAFGTGVHMCVGMHLAKLEMRCMFEALAKKVARFEVTGVKRELHNVLRGISSMEVEIRKKA